MSVRGVIYSVSCLGLEVTGTILGKYESGSITSPQSIENRFEVCYPGKGGIDRIRKFTIDRKIWERYSEGETITALYLSDKPSVVSIADAHRSEQRWSFALAVVLFLAFLASASQVVKHIRWFEKK